MTRLLFLAVLAGGLLFATGCGAGTGNVTGKVEFNGKPVRGGRVTFTVVKGDKFYGDNKSCAIKDDGTYSLEKIPAGDVKITVETSLKVQTNTGGGGGSMPKDMGAGMKPETSEDYSATPDKFVQLPPRFANVQQTDLTYKVTAGPQTYDIIMKP